MTHTKSLAFVFFVSACAAEVAVEEELVDRCQDIVECFRTCDDDCYECDRPDDLASQFATDLLACEQYYCSDPVNRTTCMEDHCWNLMAQCETPGIYDESYRPRTPEDIRNRSCWELDQALKRCRSDIECGDEYFFHTEPRTRAMWVDWSVHIDRFCGYVCEAVTPDCGRYEACWRQEDCDYCIAIEFDRWPECYPPGTTAPEPEPEPEPEPDCSRYTGLAACLCLYPHDPGLCSSFV